MLSSYIIGLIDGCDGSTESAAGIIQVRVNGEWRDATPAERLAAAKSMYRARVRSAALALIDGKYTAAERLSLTLGVYTVASAAPAQAWIGSVAEKVRATVAQINAATTVQQLDDGWAALTWPAAPAGALVSDDAEFVARMAGAQAMRDAAAQAITDLTALIGTSGTLTGAQLSNYLRGMATILRGLVRHTSRSL